MLTKEFTDFTIKDLSFDYDYPYTQEEIEKITDDKFVAMTINNEGVPEYIWTEKFVITVVNTEFTLGQTAMTIAYRNPVDVNR